MADYKIDQCYSSDEYGGFTDLPVSGGATGYFRIGQLGDRWTFVTPLGNAFLYKGIMVWNPSAARLEPHLLRKYGNIRVPGNYTPFVLQRWARMLGINMLGWGCTYYHMPVPFLGQGNTVAALGCGFPMLPNHGPAMPSVGKGVKDILRGGGNDDVDNPGLCGGGVKIAAWGGGGTRRAMLDFGDPNYGPIDGGNGEGTTIWFAIQNRKNEFAGGKPAGFDFALDPSSSWLIANSPDDADTFFGHKGAISIHPGWVSCVTSPWQRKSVAVLNQTYGVTSGASQPQVYCKLLARGWLQNKYGSIQNLNASWGNGCNYTTWDSSDPDDPMRGWQLGTGTGFLDEDGVDHPWIKVDTTKGVYQFHYMADCRVLPPNVKADLDAIMEYNVEILYHQYADCFRAEYPNHLLGGPSALKNDLGLYKPGVLRAAGRVFDFLQVDYNPTRDGQQTYAPTPPGDPFGFPSGDATVALERTYNLARKPILAWQSAEGMPDSAAQRIAAATPQWQWNGEWASDPRMKSTQEGKGGEYIRHLNDMFSATGDDGKKFWLGFDNWSPVDVHGESMNWGFTTEHDGAYDGRETDPFGQTSSPARRGIGLGNRHMITDALGWPIPRWVSGPDNQIYVRGRYGDSITLIRAGTRNAELRWLSLAGAEEPPEPPVTGRTLRHGGSTRVGGSIHP